ncbi:MAG: hypothetical protein J0M24_10210 [Verrucomicrobia bacterium]|nr:hypothetical protein [Verrucomicrobiota bacterium]
MNSSATPEQQRLWMEAWRVAGAALEELKRQELGSLTEEQACALSETLLQGITFPQPPSWRDQSSGLVEQQRWFQRYVPSR